ncbi:unnamed protein product [Parajaminaea phylloscopi]
MPSRPPSHPASPTSGTLRPLPPHLSQEASHLPSHHHRQQHLHDPIRPIRPHYHEDPRRDIPHGPDHNPKGAADDMAVSTASAQGSLRLPSFAELNERLNFPEYGSFAPSASRPRLPGFGTHPALALPSRRSSAAVVDGFSHPSNKDDEASAALMTPLSDRGAFERSGRRSPEELYRPAPASTGLTASWLPVDDPGRPSAPRSHLRPDGGSLPTRRATVSQGGERPLSASQHRGPLGNRPVMSSAQTSPKWDPYGPVGKVPSGLSLPVSSSSSSSSSPAGSSHRYHPFAREPSTSPDHHRIAATANHADYIGPATSAPRRRGKLPKDVTELLKGWLMEHSSHPYPNEDEKRRLCLSTGLSISQVSNWFINARRRILAPQQSAAAAAAAAVSPARHGVATTPTGEMPGNHSASSSFGRPSPPSTGAEEDYFPPHYDHSAGRGMHYQTHPQRSPTYRHQPYAAATHPSASIKQNRSQQYLPPLQDALSRRSPPHPQPQYHHRH